MRTNLFSILLSHGMHYLFYLDIIFLATVQLQTSLDNALRKSMPCGKSTTSQIIIIESLR